MTYKFTKNISILFLLIIVSCQTSISPLHENEKKLVGNWLKAVNNGQVKGLYMEFHEDRTGVFGPSMNINGTIGLLPYMSLQMKDWSLRNDTLSIELGMQSGYVAIGPDGNEIKQKEKPSLASYFV